MSARARTLAPWAMVVLLAAFTCAVAWPHLAGEVTFFGDSDRLNTFLNIKLAETVSIQESGRVSAWNENNFMGFSMRGLYWMMPGLNPDAYAHARLPIEDLFRNAGLVTFGLLLLAMAAAYAFLLDLTSGALASAVGACMYGCSALSLGRLAQVDSAYFTIVLLPLGMLALRRTSGASWRAWFVLLAGALAVMLGLAFLQEAAYTLVLFGAYALFRSLQQRSPRPILVLGAAFAAAALVAAPRIIGVAEEFGLMFRTTQPSYTGPNEFLRVLHDGIFGRYWREAWEVMGNVGFNMHEGIQTYSSTVAVLLVLLVVFLVDVRRHWLPVAVLISVLAAIAYAFRPVLGILAAFAGALVGAYEYRASRRGERVAVAEPAEFGFHLAAFALVLGLVLVPALRAILYYGFFKIDFLHSRVVIAALLPLAAVTALLVAGMTRAADDAPPTREQLRWSLLLALCAALATAALHYGVFGWEAGLDVAARKVTFRHLNLSLAVLLRTLALGAFVVVAIVVFRKGAGGPAARPILGYCLMAVIAVECFLYAHERLLGEHTRTYPVAFRTNNYFSAPAGVLRPPSAKCRAELQARLDNERYRTVVVADPVRFQPFAAPHLGQFWQVRLLDGYPGLPRRLAELPWPAGVASLRAIAFRSADAIPWRLLAILNVRNAIVLDEPLYYNAVAAAERAAACPGLTALAVLDNPFPAAPRQYFAAEVRPASRHEPVQPVEQLRAHVRAPGEALVTWWAQTLDGDIEIDVRRPGETAFATVGRHSPLGESKMILFGANAAPGNEIRARKLDHRGQVRFVTTTVPIASAAAAADPRADHEALLRKAFPYDISKTAVVEGVDSARTYAATGSIRARYAGDVARFEVDPVDAPRFLVVNELFHPRWHAYVDGQQRPIRVANRVMRGIEVPAGARTIELRFEPFTSTPAALALLSAGGLVFGVFLLWGRRLMSALEGLP